MASGVKLDSYPMQVQEALVLTQLDNDRSEYYKLMAQLHTATGDIVQANLFIKKYAKIVLPEMKDDGPSKEEAIQRELANMDKWMLKIDVDSLPKPTTGLILRKDPPKSKRKRAGRLANG